MFHPRSKVVWTGQSIQLKVANSEIRGNLIEAAKKTRPGLRPDPLRKRSKEVKNQGVSVLATRKPTLLSRSVE
jgi:hypothetical protein